MEDPAAAQAPQPEDQAAVAQLQQQLQAAQAQAQAAQAQAQAAQAQNAALYQSMQQAQQVAYQLAVNQAQAAAPAPPPQRNQAAEALLRLPGQQFEGKRGSGKFLRGWLADMETRYSVMQPAPTDGEKIAYAAALLRGTAKTWYLQQGHLLPTWADFTAALERKYKPLNQEEHGRPPDHAEADRLHCSLLCYLQRPGDGDPRHP
jgi:hypothetical protein